MKAPKILAVAVTTTLFSVGASAVPITTDIISIVDESGSMGGEHAWIGGMITDLNALLATAAGSDPFSPQYGLTGYGGHIGNQLAHKHSVGSGEFGSAAQFDTASDNLVASGGFEDGYQAMDFALNNYGLRSGALTNLILVTDEDRDENRSLFDSDAATMLSTLQAENALLNAVLNVSLACGDGSTALGLDATGTGYVADGSGGFTTCTGATAVFGFGSTINDYLDLALATGGGAWDLNQLRAGGLTAQSFTDAFVSLKVQETLGGLQPVIAVPEPGSLALMGLGLAGLGTLRRRMKK